MTRDYVTLAEQERGRYRDFPKINVDKQQRAVNDLFKAYIFITPDRKAETVKAQTSCCGKSVVLPQRTMTPATTAIFYGRHKDRAVCQFCGKWAEIKETRYLGRRVLLEEHHPVVLLSEEGGNLYARAYWAQKDYKGDLTSLPLFRCVGMYRFAPGKAQKWEIFKWDQPDGITALKYIKEPFTDGEGYICYKVFGMEAIETSAFRYCGYDLWRSQKRGGNIHISMMRFFALCTQYPRQVEMLLKAGMEDIVSDYIYQGKKNAAVLDWGATDLLTGFGLTKEEWNTFRRLGADCRIIGWYKQLRRWKVPTSMEALAEIDKSMEWNKAQQLVDLSRRRGIRPDKVYKYLQKQTGPRCHGGYFGMGQAFQTWKDYIDIAEQLHWDVKDPTVLLPRQLELKHNEAAREITLMKERLAAEKDKELQKKARKRLKDWHKKYDVAADGYFIRVADSVSEIVQEGKTLQHCVGGKAERHMKGETTILFLRREETPSASLYTIEMWGNRLIQVHGFQNENKGAPAPRRTMAWLLDPWLKWIEQGSPRKKDGTPKIKIEKKETEVA